MVPCRDSVAYSWQFLPVSATATLILSRSLSPEHTYGMHVGSGCSLFGAALIVERLQGFNELDSSVLSDSVANTEKLGALSRPPNSCMDAAAAAAAVSGAGVVAFAAVEDAPEGLLAGA